MSKYIKLEDAIGMFGRSGEYHADAIVDMLFYLPTIDIVRCKDCKHYFSGNWCEILKAESMVENGFCAYGERTEE